ncbi:hypothetical protein [Leifsonia sp. NPDC080035]|uniref:YtxH domain-containing protein n=1 Tax=Leifsonia sp. NPDC080035 TaxID=3143936 RepID=A0AAU7GGB6_9MICO
MKIIIFLAGVGVGFVIGSKAGRGAYENMRRKWEGFSGSDPVQQVKGEVRDFAGKASDKLGDKVSEVVGKASDKLDEVTGKNGDTTPTEA